MKLTRFVSAVSLFTMLLLAVNWLHFRYFSLDVVFYAAILDALITASIFSLLLFAWDYFSIFGGFEKFLIMMILGLGGYGYAISVPTVIDRSLSFYILEKLEQRGGGILMSQMDKVFKDEYMFEHRLLDVRITEQLASGSIRVEDGCVKLTARGQSLAKLSSAYRKYLLPRKRLILESYTDDLTEPFRNSSEAFDYQCQ